MKTSKSRTAEARERQATKDADTTVGAKKGALAAVREKNEGD